MYPLNPAVLRWLADRHGVITNADLERLGVTFHQRQRLLRTGVLVKTSAEFTGWLPHQ